MFNTRVRTLFVLFCFLFFSHLFLFLKTKTKQLVIPNPVAFLLNVTSTVMFWMSACQSILCTVHLTWSLCSPAGSFVVCGCVVGWQCPPHPPMLYLCEDSVRGFVSVHGLLEDNLYKPNSSENKKEQSEMHRRNSVTSQCAAMTCRCDFFNR